MWHPTVVLEPLPQARNFYVCHYCNKLLSCKTSLALHIAAHLAAEELEANLERGPAAFRCPHCLKTFLRKSNFTVHERTHWTQLESNCTVPERTHETQRERLYSCLRCPKTFLRKSNFTVHERTHGTQLESNCTVPERTHETQRERLYSCLRCPKTFLRKSNCTVHERTHGTQLESNCTVHEGTHGTQRQRLYNCLRCPKKFFRKSNLAVHMRVHERTCRGADRFPFHCQFCRKKFETQIAFRIHKNLHTWKEMARKKYPRKRKKTQRNQKENKTYQCTYCSEEFDSQWHRINHERIHSGQMPYHCSKCSKLSNRNLAHHECACSSKEPAYQCLLCSQEFPNRRDLTRHKRTHPVYQCSRKWGWVDLERRQENQRNESTSSAVHLPVEVCDRTSPSSPPVLVQRSHVDGSLSPETMSSGSTNIPLIEGPPTQQDSCQDGCLVPEAHVKRSPSPEAISGSVNVPVIVCLPTQQDSSQDGCLDPEAHVKRSPSPDTISGSENVALVENPLTQQDSSQDSSRSPELLVSELELVYQKPHTCSRCSDRFYSNLGLALHERTHRVENLDEPSPKTSPGAWDVPVKEERRPYACTRCPKTYSTGIGLKYHVRTHTNARPYRCLSCTKTFSTSALRNRHKGMHAQGKSYRCLACLEKFTSRQGLAYHERRHMTEASVKM